MSKHGFQTEVNQLLNLIINSLYSHKEIFIRELVSNASDALDKMKYLTISDDKFKSVKFEPKIDITIHESEGSNVLEVADTGIGMNNEDLIENLGTIAQSGTKQFINNLTGDAKKDSNLIGQFGVGFYSTFMVADKVEVISKKAGEDTAWKWTSDGKSGYEIVEAERDTSGTTVIVYLNEEGAEYASRYQIQDIVKRYSDHIAFPIHLHYTEKTSEGEGENKKEKIQQKSEQVNAASALWKRSKSELTEKDYNEFYKTIAHDSEDPMLYLHTKAEGTMLYTTLFYVPKKAPFDMNYADYKAGVKLYVKRVFITDEDKDLMPTYLRFVRGIIDSEDLPLNVSREILQKNRVLANIKNKAVKKLLAEFKSISENNPEMYKDFISQYNRPLKEGLYSDYENRETLLELVRFKSSSEEGITSLSEYKDRMKENQKAIYYITGGSEQVLRNSPLLEAYREKGIEVLIMDDEIDEIVVPSIGTYKEIELKAVNRTGSDEELKTEKDKEKEKEVTPLIKKIKAALGDKVKDVVASTRLSDSPSCIVADANDPTVQMQQMLKAMGQDGMPETKPILEINPKHMIIEKLSQTKDKDVIEDISFLLFEQALLVENAPIKDPASFVKRLNKVMQNSL